MKIRRENRQRQIKNDKDRPTMRRENRRDKVIDRRIAESCVPWMEWTGYWRLRKVTQKGRWAQRRDPAFSHRHPRGRYFSRVEEEECEGTLGEEAQRPG